MRGEYAPDAIQNLYRRLVALAPAMYLDLAGIVGDPAHTYGYHRARAVLPATDYSVQLPADRLGDQWACSAIDIKPGHPAGMAALTRRMKRAVEQGDSRVFGAVREFYGTLDGEQVYGWDLPSMSFQASDDSHLWHLHISFYRSQANNRSALSQVADLLAPPLRGRM